MPPYSPTLVECRNNCLGKQHEAHLGRRDSTILSLMQTMVNVAHHERRPLHVMLFDVQKMFNGSKGIIRFKRCLQEAIGFKRGYCVQKRSCGLTIVV